ncbi:MAG: hypothetical protein VKK62_00015 [Synechococcaceae cyanobacterium]|nr:hypothetical protein [Synechococcaceae cyanobacterium]
MPALLPIVPAVVLPPLLACSFSRDPTPASLLFQLGLLIACGAGLLWLSRFCDRLPLRLALMALGVLLFELFTAPMWHNEHLGWWAYLYRDVSWMLTLGWAVLFLLVVEVGDRLMAGWRAWKRFAVDLVVLTLAVLPLELLVVKLGIRGYAPEVQEAAVGGWIQGVPVAAIYYIPVFSALVLGFYRYWRFVIDDELLIPVRRLRWGRGLLLSLIAVLLLELMVEPMVINRGLPSWSFLYRDISWLISGLWVLVIAITGVLVQRFALDRSILFRFLLALAIATAIALPIEYGLVSLGIRVYGPSAMGNFSGFVIPALQAPIEIAFAIPCYMALMFGFIRYWEIVLDNRL